MNREHLNEEGPMLIVSNHNNAFLDAVVVEMFAKRQIYSIARGDVFANPYIRSILNQLYILPIFRKEEGVKLMHKNEETFERCIELLGAKQQIIMYPEGDCVPEKRLRRLRKGAARIALRAEAKENFSLNLKVLPIGLNYSAAKKFRSHLFINIGNPISLKEYEKLYAEDKVKAVNNLTLHMERDMKTLVVGLDHHANDTAFEEVLEIYKAELMQSLGLNLDNLHHDNQANRQIASTLNYFHHHHHGKVLSFKQHLHDYHKALDKLHIPHRLFTPDTIKKLGLFSSSKNLFLLGLGMPLHAVGLLFNYLPYRFAYNTADKKVKQAHFHASVNFVIGMFSWIGYYLFQLLVIGLISKSSLVTLAFAFIVPATGMYSLKFYSFMRKTNAQWNLLSLVQNNEHHLELLLKNRQVLISEIEEAKKIYCSKKETELKGAQLSKTMGSA